MAHYALLLVIVVEYLGLSYRLPVLRATKFSMLTSLLLLLYVVARNPDLKIIRFKQSIIVFIMLFMTFASIFFSLIQRQSLRVFEQQFGYVIIFVIAYYVFDNRKKIMQLMFVLALSHVYLVAANSAKLFSVKRIGSFEGGFFVANGNDLAWSLVIVLPYTFYLIHQWKGALFKSFGVGVALFLIYGIIGSGSRGAALGLMAIFGYWTVASKRKGRSALVVAVLIVGILIVAPALYLERLSTIKNYEEDSSAMGRISAWKAAVHMAFDHPFGVGAGNFSSAYGRYYRYLYADPNRWEGMRWIAAHSIYFLILAEYGFIGLFLLLYLLYSTFKENLRLRTAAASGKSELAEVYFNCLNMSLVGYSVCGIFLGGINYPHFYILLAIILSGRMILERDNPAMRAGAKLSRAAPRRPA